MTPVEQPKAAAQEYARLLVKMHELDPLGENESPELDALCEQLATYWSAMSGAEQNRVRELSKDLYALAEGRQGVSMLPEQRRQWSLRGQTALLSGDVDAHLEHLRQPFPKDMPLGMIQFLQSRCWERLGNAEVAGVFLREAAKSIPTAKLSSMDYLQQLGRSNKPAEFAEGFIADLMYFAGS
jgi:hypothetical protein